MNDATPPSAPDATYPPPNAAAFTGADSRPVDDLVAHAHASITKPAATRTQRRSARPRRAHAPGSGASPVILMLGWGLVGIVLLGIGAYATGAIQLGPTGSSPTDVNGGTSADGSWSYYHDTDYEAGSDGAKWSTDRSRSSDPDEAALGDSSRWEYDGPYRYGSYGSDGMRRRESGRDATDPLYSQPAATPDVFSQYGGDLDPSGGNPVGVAPSNLTRPYFDPYAGYSNPYANRIRMAYGEGIGRGASYDSMP